MFEYDYYKLMNMNSEELREFLGKLWCALDDVQDNDLIQSSEEAMWEIGEAMGAIDNARDIIEEMGDKDMED